MVILNLRQRKLQRKCSTNLSEQLYVDVQTTSKLNEQLLQTISNNTVRETSTESIKDDRNKISI